MRDEEREKEAAIIARAKLGCCKAITSLLGKALLKLNQYLYSTNLNHTDVEDISQEALIKAWLNLNKFSGKSSFYTWVKCIANQLIKRKYRTPKPFFCELSGNLIDTKPSPLEQLIKEEQTLVLQSFLQTLPPTEQLVFKLHVLDALPYKDVCAKTGQRNWAARKACQRAIIKWEKYLTNEQKELSEKKKKQEYREINKKPIGQIYRRFLPWTNSNGKRLSNKVRWNKEAEESTCKTSCFN